MFFFTDKLPNFHPHHQNSGVKASSQPDEIHRLQIQVRPSRFFPVFSSNLSGYSSWASSLSPHLRLAKSTLTLIPLLGIHYMVFIFVTDESTHSTISLRLTKLFIDLFFSSFQVQNCFSPNNLVQSTILVLAGWLFLWCHSFWDDVSDV